MSTQTIETFTCGDRFSLSYNNAMTGKASVMIADVKPTRSNEILATLDVTEDTETEGLYYMETDADTSNWPQCVRVDVYYTDTKKHDDTMVYAFREAVTHAADHEA